MTINQIEQQIRQLRQRVFDGTPEQQDATTAEIVRLKKLAATYWNDRQSAHESSYARVMWM